MAAPSLADLGIGRLFDLVPDAVVIGDVATGRVIGWNTAAEEIFGYSTQRAMGMELEQLVPAPLRPAHLAGLARYAAGGGGQLAGSRELVELPAVHADGHEFWVELRLSPIDSGDARRHVLAVFRDVTARRQAMARADAANASLREFLTMAAHDLRGPAAGVAMTLDMFAGSCWERLSDDQRSELLAGARRQARFVVSLLGDLAEVAALEAGQDQPTPEDCDVEPLVRQAVEISGAEVSVDTPAGLRLRVDPSHLSRVLLNLIGNADRYGRPPISIRATQNRSNVTIDVEDRGDGIPADLQARMFDKFVRGPSPAQPRHGAGLGLAIVAGLVAASGGAVTYEPLPGGGSRFRCTWPLHEPDR